MHLLRVDTHSLDEAERAVDLGQSPAEFVFLSFSDSDLGVLASAWDTDHRGPRNVRIASLAALKHPFSIDLYLEKVATRARFVLVRLLGGLDYWRYGVEELSRAARAGGFALALLPGDGAADPRLEAASTVPPEDLARLWAYFEEGGADNMRRLLGFVGDRLGYGTAWAEPEAVPRAGVFAAACRQASAEAPRAAIVFYRALLLAADTAPIVALADALAARGFRVAALYATSLKDPAAAAIVADRLGLEKPHVILNATAFSARLDKGASVLDGADCPVFQVILAGSRREAWVERAGGLAAADLAMNVVLPETDGRLVTRAISFKAEAERRDSLEFTRVVHRPEPSRVGYVADLAAAWARLRRRPRAERLVGLILSDYPGKGGRTGYAVGLDTPASVAAIAADLRGAGYSVGKLPQCDALMAALGRTEESWPVAAYAARFRELPPGFRASVAAAWGAPEDDPALREGAFRFRLLRAGNLLVAVQPDRGRAASRRVDYHDADLAPRHAYVAFYLWLRHAAGVDAVVHCGTHGTLEWLPGKPVALSPDCAPEAVLGPVPVIYPFIVNNPGEAAQAKRRLSAVTVGHLTPPLIEAGAHGAAAELEGLFDEYAEAQNLDPRRARLLADAILTRAGETGLAEESGVEPDAPAEEALARLDAWLCDLKEMRIGDGLHVFGRLRDTVRFRETVAGLAAASGAGEAAVAAALDACAAAETEGLAAALDGRFVHPGPAGAPSRGRLDVLPTGRNLTAVDPRAVPTRTAWEIGRRTADEVLTRFVQDHGDWPKRIVIDLWGSATMRTGGDDLAQALALMGVKPVWDHASTRVSGFEIQPLALLGRPRADVTLRISGLFRDVFPTQIALFDEAVRAVAALSESDRDNPLAAAARAVPPSRRREATWRVFGSTPGTYGIGLAGLIAAGDWETRDDLGAAYLAGSSHAYGAGSDAVEAGAAFRARVAEAEAFVHVQDIADQDVLTADAFAEHEGGFAAAAASLGGEPALYHADATGGERTTVRALSQEVARVVRARASNPRWIAGQMRHGHRGAAEIAETVDNLFAFAATTDAVPSRHFDLLFTAICEDEAMRDFLARANPEAARAIAERFAEAARRGFWVSRRNSSAVRLAEMMEATT